MYDDDERFLSPSLLPLLLGIHELEKQSKKKRYICGKRRRAKLLLLATSYTSIVDDGRRGSRVRRKKRGAMASKRYVNYDVIFVTRLTQSQNDVIDIPTIVVFGIQRLFRRRPGTRFFFGGGKNEKPTMAAGCRLATE